MLLLWVCPRCLELCPVSLAAHSRSRLCWMSVSVTASCLGCSAEAFEAFDCDAFFVVSAFGFSPESVISFVELSVRECTKTDFLLTGVCASVLLAGAVDDGGPALSGVSPNNRLWQAPNNRAAEKMKVGCFRRIREILPRYNTKAKVLVRSGLSLTLYQAVL